MNEDGTANEAEIRENQTQRIVEWLCANSEAALGGWGYIERAEEVAREIAREFRVPVPELSDLP